jgi:hypothetical protein
MCYLKVLEAGHRELRIAVLIVFRRDQYLIFGIAKEVLLPEHGLTSGWSNSKLGMRDDESNRLIT